MKAWGLLTGVILLAGVSVADDFKTIHTEVSKIQVAIDDAISCVHIPDGAYTRKGIILHLDHRKIDFDDTTRNPQLGLYGLSTEWDLLPLGLDCRYVDGLRARSDNGVLTLFARRTVQEGVGSSYRGTLTCEQGLMETLEFDLAEGLAGYIKYRMPIQTDRYDGQCNTVQPLREKALIKFHLRGSDAGFQCDAVEDNGGASVISVKPYDTPLASTQRIRSESRFADHKACEAKRLDLMARSKEDDPDNTGQYIEARLKLTRKISPDNASEKVIQRLDVEIYQLRFSATQIFTVKE